MLKQYFKPTKNEYQPNKWDKSSSLVSPLSEKLNEALIWEQTFEARPKEVIFQPPSRFKNLGLLRLRYRADK